MTSNIKSFSVYGLFGTNDVHIPFDEDVKILIGENGIGKTQVLSMFYYTLMGDFRSLLQFAFEKLEIVFLRNIIKISKSDLNTLSLEYSSILELVERYGMEKVIEFRNLEHADVSEKLTNNIFLKEIFTKKVDFFDNVYKNNAYFSRLPKKITILLQNFDKNKRILIQQLSEEIIFLPTFRRIEFDLHNLGYDTKDIELNKENILIQFGMRDVGERFEKIEEDIENLLKNGLSDFTKNILEIVAEINPKIANDAVFDKINEEDLDIIFARVGNGLEQNVKDTIKEAVKTKQFKNPFAGFLLQKLIEIYEKQKTLDNSIKAFRDVCNGYLINKKVFYDESAIKIYLKSDATNAEIELSKLSSGEKQIISIFSKIYLSEAEKRFIVLFDEPELSLSVFWQKKLLPDIMKSKKCNFLLAVTHSPFIFDNDLDKYAIGLNEYIKPANQVPVAL